MKIVTVVGARPQFIKAAVVSRAIADYQQQSASPSAPVREIILHTGQHFDENMSQIFFEELDIPPPTYNLGIAETSHGAMTGRMLEGIEEILFREQPDWVVVYGDTNSTLAGALAAAKLQIPVAHVEAGLRSFNRAMPEEINRIVTDHVASLLFCPTQAAVENLKGEGFQSFLEPPHEAEGWPKDLAASLRSMRPARSSLVCQVGDVMYDAALYYGSKADRVSKVLGELRMQPRGYVLATVHRAENTDNPERLGNIFSGLRRLAREMPVVLPLHPRTLKALEPMDTGAMKAQGLILMEPVGYLDMICLERNARLIITDSGGVQKEAFFYDVPCLTLRRETEWVELVELGWNRLVDADPHAIMQGVAETAGWRPLAPGKNLYGNGDAGRIILQVLLKIPSGGIWGGK